MLIISPEKILHGLAETIKAWLSLYHEKKHPGSSAMPLANLETKCEKYPCQFVHNLIILTNIFRAIMSVFIIRNLRNSVKLIIQIPCFNEAQTLAVALSALPRKVSGFDTVEWLIIDDGSLDDTVRIAKENGVDHIIRHPRNQGLAQAFMTGLDASPAWERMLS